MLIQQFVISGMYCGACAFTIQKNLKRIKGVKDASVDYNKKELKIRYDERDVREKELADSIAPFGYKLEKKVA